MKHVTVSWTDDTEGDFLNIKKVEDAEAWLILVHEDGSLTWVSGANCYCVTIEEESGGESE